VADVELSPLGSGAALQLCAKLIAVALAMVQQGEEGVVDGQRSRWWLAG
jgi:hypothetical protein